MGPARDVASEASAVRPPETPHRVAHQGASGFVGHETTGGPAAARAHGSAGSASRACRPDEGMETAITETSIPLVAVDARPSSRFGGAPALPQGPHAPTNLNSNRIRSVI